MPSLVGTIKIVNVGPSSIVQFGDSVQLSPHSSTKTFTGAGSFNTGDFVTTHNAIVTQIQMIKMCWILFKAKLEIKWLFSIK
jgi:spore germination protein PA